MRLSISLLSCFFVISCASMQSAQPVAKGRLQSNLASMDFSGGNENGFLLNAKIEVENTGNALLAIQGADATLVIDALVHVDGQGVRNAKPALEVFPHLNKALQGSDSTRLELAPGDKKVMRVAMVLPWPDDPARYEEFAKYDVFMSTLNVTFALDDEVESVGYNHELTVPKLPNIKLDEVQVSRVHGSLAGTLYVSILAENQNAFPIELENIKWNIFSEATSLRADGDRENEEIVPHTTLVFEESVDLASAELSEETIRSLLSAESLKYRSELEYTLFGKTFKKFFEGEEQFPL